MASLIVAAVSGIFGVVAVLFAARTLQVTKKQLSLQKDVIAAQGIFNAPQLSCSLISEDCPKDIIIATNVRPSRVSEVQLPFRLSNTGTKSAEQVTIYIRMPNELFWDGRADVHSKQDAWLDVKNGRIAVIPEKEFSTVIFTLPRLPTHEAIQIFLPISIRCETLIQDTVTAPSKDNVMMSIELSVALSLGVHIFAACEGAPPFTRVHALQIVNTNEKTTREAINGRNVALRSKVTTDTLPKSLAEFWSRTIRFLRERKHKPQTSKVFVYTTSEKDRVSDEKYPLDRYGIDHASYCQGSMDTRDGTVWVPALGTTFFGIGPSPFPTHNDDSIKPATGR